MRSMLSTVQKFGIKELLLVPPILIRLVRDPVVEEYDLSCVERFSSGAAPLSEEVSVHDLLLLNVQDWLETGSICPSEF